MKTRVSCPACMKFMLTSSNTWVVAKFVINHQNHELSNFDNIFNHYFHKTKTIRSWIADLRKEGISLTTISKVLNVLNIDEEGDSHKYKIITQQDQVTDYTRKIKKSNIGNRFIFVIRHFQDRRESSRLLFFYEDG